MTNYTCSNGQSWFDVVLNTYQTVDQYVKLLNDNGQVPEVPPVAGQVIVWDETIVQNAIQAQQTNDNGITYATLGTIPQLINTAPVGTYNAPQPQIQYVATSTETEITISQLQTTGAQVTSGSIDEVPLKDSDYTVNYTTGVITLLNGKQLNYFSAGKAQTLFLNWT